MSELDMSNLVFDDEQEQQASPSLDNLVFDDEPDRTVFHEESGKTVNVPAGLSAAEADYKIKTDALGEPKHNFFGMTNIVQKVLPYAMSVAFDPPTAEEVKKAAGGLARGAAGGLERVVPEIVGGSALEFGERMLQRREQIKSKQKVLQPDLGLAYKAQGVVFDAASQTPGFAELMKSAGKSLVNKNQKFLDAHGLSKQKADGISYDIGAGFGSIATAVGMTMATKNPAYAAALFGGLQKTETYKEIRKAQAEGKMEGGADEAGTLSTVFGAAEAAIEAFGGKFLLGASAVSKPLSKILKRTASEVAQESSQQATEESLAMATGLRPVDIQGAIERTLYAGAIGGIVGAPVHIVTHYIEERGKDEGLSEKQIKLILEKYKENESEFHKVAAEMLEREGSSIVSDPEAEKQVGEIVRKYKAGEPIEIPSNLGADGDAVVKALVDGIAGEDAERKAGVGTNIAASESVKEPTESEVIKEDGVTSSEVLSGLGSYLRREQNLTTRKQKDGSTSLIINGKEIGSVKGDVTSDTAVRAIAERLTAKLKKEKKTLTKDTSKMSLDEFTLAYELGKMFPEFEIVGAEFGTVIKTNSDGSLGVDIKELYNKFKAEQESGGTGLEVLNDSAASLAPRTIKDGRQFSDFAINNKPSFRRQLFEAMGLDHARAVNMSPNELIERAKPLFLRKYGVQIEVGDKAQVIHALDNLTDAWVTFQFFTNVLGIPDSAIGLKGMKVTVDNQTSNNIMKLQFVKSGGGVLGSYDPSTNTIELPGRSNSFAHEWGHALDFYVLDVMGKTRDAMGGFFSGYTSRIRREGESYEPNSVSEAWINLMNTMFFEESFSAAKIMELQQKLGRARTDKTKAEIIQEIEKVKSGNYRGNDHRSAYIAAGLRMDKMSGKKYWSKPTEMLARAFESYMAWKVEAIGGSTDMLSKGSDAYNNTQEEFALRYPQLEDRLRIFLAIDQMIQKVREAGILETGNLDPITNDNMNTLDPKHWSEIPEETMPRGILAKIRKAFSKEEREARRLAEKDAAERKVTLVKDPQGFLTHFNTLFSTYARPFASTLQIIKARNSSSPTVARLVDMLAVEVGSGAVQSQSQYHAMLHLIEDKYRNRLGIIQRQFRLRPDSIKEAKAANEILQGLPRTEILSPEREAALTEAMARLREDVYKPMFYELEAALSTVDKSIGYVRDAGYMNQIFNVPYIYANQVEATDRLQHAYAITIRKAYDSKDGLQEIVDDAMKHFPRDPRTAALITAIKEGVGAATIAEIANDLSGDIIDYLSKAQANALIGRIIAGADSLFEGESGNGLTKSRSFPAETLAILQPIRINNPLDAVKLYIDGAARVVAYTKTFGTDEKLDAARIQAVLHEKANPEDMALLIQSIKELTGRDANYLNPAGVRNIANTTMTFTVLNLMGRSGFASMPETFVSGMKTGRARDGFIAFGNMIGSMLDTGNSHDIRRDLEFMGVLVNKSADRSFDDIYGTSQKYTKANRMAAQFYENNFIGVLTRHSKLAAAKIWMSTLRRLSDTIKDPKSGKLAKQRAIADLHDYGIQDAEKFAEYVISLGDKLYPAVGDASPMAAQFWESTKSFTDKTIQRPSALTKPRAAVEGRQPMMYTLMGFNFAYWENVMKTIPRWYSAEFKRLGGDKSDAAHAFANTAARFLPPYLAYLGMTTLIFLLRTMLFNRENFEKKTAEEQMAYIIQGGIAYTLPGGPVADVLFNLVKGVKYNRDFTTLTAGAGNASALQTMSNLIKSFSGKETKGNSQERARVKAFYEIVVQPIATAATATLSGPAGVAMGVANMAIGSQDAKEAVVKAFAGEKKENGKKGFGKL